MPDYRDVTAERGPAADATGRPRRDSCPHAHELQRALVQASLLLVHDQRSTHRRGA